MSTTSHSRPRVPAKCIAISLAIVAVVLITGLVAMPDLCSRILSTARLTSSETVQKTNADDDHDDYEGHSYDDHNHTGDADGHDHSEHDHDHGDHSHEHNEATSIELSPQARGNLGLTKDKVSSVKLETFTRVVTVPAMVVERSGYTKLQVAAPMSGVITTVSVLEGEVIPPGTEMYTLRLTHKDMVAAQTEFLKTLGEVDVMREDIDRIEEVTNQGAIAGKVLIEKKHEQHINEAMKDAYREALHLHGLTNEQIDEIEESRKLLREVTIFAPEWPTANSAVTTEAATPSDTASTADGKLPREFQVQELNVESGQYADVGESLGTLADFRELYIKGRAFEHDAQELTAAAVSGLEVEAVLESSKNSPEEIRGLKILYVNNEIDSDSRALFFYVGLPNAVAHVNTTPEGHRFVSWKFKPGQRMQVRVPVEQWSDRIVLPVDAVAQEGAESYVFQENEGHFDRQPVRVLYRDQTKVVIDPDGSIAEGDRVALSGAHQLQMALKNKAGGGVDPHAGHSH